MKTPSPPTVRPERVAPEEVPDLPEISPEEEAAASTIYSRFRTGLSRRRTGLSEHRTDLSEFRTDLSEHRTELGMDRTGMAIHRTRMAADRTLMAEMRTSLSMIGFGFTIYQAFRSMAQADILAGEAAPRNFGLSLIVLGMVILAGGIWRQLQFAHELRKRRAKLIDEGILHGESTYPISVSLLVSLGLFGVGCVALLNIVFGLTLFGSG